MGGEVEPALELELMLVSGPAVAPPLKLPDEIYQEYSGRVITKTLVHTD
ncbi:6821_t:CDS:1, partial [Paraglomus occultum]